MLDIYPRDLGLFSEVWMGRTKLICPNNVALLP